MMDLLINAFKDSHPLELVSALFGLAYIVLARKENIWCWPAAFIGTATAVVLFWDASLLMESALNVYYLVMAVYGWWQWTYFTTHNKTSDKLAALKKPIVSWGLKQHSVFIISVIILSAISGYLLQHNTQADFAYLDSLTTWSAVICTWMVAKKILENWLYWVVIDIASIYLYLQKGLFFYSALFFIYTVIACFAYFTWRKNYLQQSV